MGRGLLDLLTADIRKLLVDGLYFVLSMQTADNRFLFLASRLHHLGNRIRDIFPAFARTPRPLSLIPWSPEACPVGHVVVGVRESWIALQNSRREIRLDSAQSSSEHLEVRDLPGHQEAQRLLYTRIIRELQ